MAKKEKTNLKEKSVDSASRENTQCSMTRAQIANFGFSSR